MKKNLENFVWAHRDAILHIFLIVWLLCRFFYEFLLQNERGVAKEIKDEYVETMSKVYFSYFKTYASRLGKKLTTEVASKEHVLAAPEEVKGKNPLFSLGKRADLLHELEAPALVPHAWAGPPLPYEALFRSIVFTLVDNACREYLFLGEFFLQRNPQHLQDLFHLVMGRSLAHVLVSLVNYENYAKIEIKFKSNV